MILVRRRDESGASVVLALVFLSLFGLFISTILTFTESSLLVSKQASIGADQAYAADGGIEGAIQFVRNNPVAGVQTCPDFQVSGSTSVVTCVPEGLGGEDVSAPALLTLGDRSDEGVRQLGPRTLSVGGPVHSNSTIDVADPTAEMRVHGDASALGGCTGLGNVVEMRSAGPTDCSSANEVFEDRLPLLDAAADAALLPRRQGPGVTFPTLPNPESCPDPPVTISLFPGYYNNAVELNALTAPPPSPAPCAGTIIHFKPGPYYFDFGSGASRPCTTTVSTCTWTIDFPTGSVIGGAPADGGEPAADFIRPLQAQGNCGGTEGIQFVFGGESRMRIQNGIVELCGKGPPGNRQPVVYGFPTQYGDRQGVTATNTASGSGATSFNLHERALAIDDALTHAELGGSSTTASVRIGFGDVSATASAIPTGATIDVAQLRVRHREVGDLPNLTLTAVVTPGPGPALPSQTVLADNLSLDEDRIDLRSLGLDTREELNGPITVDFTATRDSGGQDVTEMLDGIELAIDYTLPTASPTSTTRSAGSAISAPAGSLSPSDAAATTIDDGAVAQASLAPDPGIPKISVAYPFAGTGLIPVGSKINSAVVRVKHGETGDPGTSVNLSVVVTPNGGTPLAPQLLAADNPSPDVDTVDLLKLGLQVPETLNQAMRVDFIAELTGGTGATLSLDGVDLLITYTPPVTAPRPATSAESTPAESLTPNDGAATTIDGTYAAASLTASPGIPRVSVRYTFPGLVGTGAIPVGATINSAQLEVAHFETVDPGESVGLSVAVTPDGGSALPALPVNSNDATARVDAINLMTTLGLDTPEELNPGMLVDFAAELQADTPEATENIDGIRMVISYTPPPAYRPPASASCLVQMPYNPATPATTCPLLEADVSATTFVTIHGGVHAPRTAVDLALATDSLLLEEGVAARTITIASAATPPVTTPRPASSAESSPAGSLAPNDGAAMTIDGTYAAASLTPSPGIPRVSVRYTFPGLVGTGAIPFGATINSALLEVAHFETVDPGEGIGLSVAVTPDGGSALPAQPVDSDNSTPRVDAIDLMTTLSLDTPEELNSGMLVDFAAELQADAPEATENIDGIRMVISYTPPICPIQVPWQARTPRVVTFETDAPLPVQATVQFQDGPADPCGPLVPAASVSVLDWAVRRPESTT